MKKYGKYEKIPVAVETKQAKQPKAKSVLLQTYFTSLICMILCVTMFFGTSYAWFTSEVTNEGNQIYIGTLDVGLYKLEGGSPVDLANSETKLFDKSIRWEPGYTTLETIQVVNKGDLAFKYALNFAAEGVAAEVAQQFQVWVYDYRENNDVAPAQTSYNAMTLPGSGWAFVGTLDQILAGNVVLDGKMVTVRDTAVDDAIVNTTDTYAIALHMSESATGVGLMGQKITMNVKLTAHQMGYEEDSFGNPDYDSVQFVSTLEELQEALDSAYGEVIIQLDSDIAGNVTVTQKEGADITIDGGNHTFNGVMTVFGNGRQTAAEKLIIQNFRFVAANGADACIVSPDRAKNDKYSYAHNVTVANCTFTDADGDKNCAAIRHEDGGDMNWTVSNCVADASMHSLLQVNNVAGKLVVSGCTVESKNGINLNSCTNVLVDNCNFDVTGYAVRFGVNSGGNIGDAKHFVLSNNVFKSACADGDAIIMFRADAVKAKLELINNVYTGTTKMSGNTADTQITEE